MSSINNVRTIIPQVAATSDENYGGYETCALASYISQLPQSNYRDQLITTFGERVLQEMKRGNSFIRKPDGVLVMDSNGNRLSSTNASLVNLTKLSQALLFENMSVILEDSNMTYVHQPMIHNSFLLSKGLYTLQPINLASLDSFPTSYANPF